MHRLAMVEKRIAAGGVNGADITAILQQKMETYTDIHLSLHCLAEIAYTPACGMH